MASIHIKNIGPIKDTGRVDLTTILLIIGRQSSGKSTFLKILSFCCWLEKVVMVSNADIVSQYTHHRKFIKDLCAFYRFNDSYFSSESFISYEGETLDILFQRGATNVSITRHPNFELLRHNTKLGFIPSERNLVSAIANIDKVYKSSERDVLFNYLFEWEEAKAIYTSEHPKQLSVSDDMEYLNQDGLDYIKLRSRNKTIPSRYTSSGVQSAMPLDVMVDYFTNLVGQKPSMSKHDLTAAVLNLLKGKDSLSDNIETLVSNELYRRLAYQSAQLFIEEPEQNLYPASQKSLLLNIIAAICRAIPKGSAPSHVVMTTHSPYILSVLNVLMAKAYAVEKSVPVESLKMDDLPDLPSSSYSAYFISPDGVFLDIVDKELTMIDGTQLDGVSDWVDDHIALINEHLYG